MLADYRARETPGIGRSQRGRSGPRADRAANRSLAKDSITSRHNDHREAGLPSKRDRHTERQSMVTTHNDYNRPGRSTLVGDRQGGPGKFFSHRSARAAPPPWLLLRLQHRANLIVQVDVRRTEAVRHVGGGFGRIVIAGLGRIYIDDLDPSLSASKNTPGSCRARRAGSDPSNPTTNTRELSSPCVATFRPPCTPLL
jgi:hypothetical protein